MRYLIVTIWAATLLSFGVGVMRFQSAAESIRTGAPYSTPRFPRLSSAAPTVNVAELVRLLPSAPVRVAASTLPSVRMDAPPRPLLRGVVGGPPWLAILAGVAPPGPEQRLVRVGDTIGPFTLVAIGPDSAVVQHGSARLVLPLAGPR